jgi:protein-tyrosine phosphatase
MMWTGLRILISAIALAGLNSQILAAITEPRVDRYDSGSVEISWQGPNPVSVYQVSDAGTPYAEGRVLARAVATGGYRADVGLQRAYFVLVDDRDHQVLRLAERLVPLQQGSNFRDLGGYETGSGKSVRWGMIYRSAGQPLLADADLEMIQRLGIVRLVDLRTTEERLLAPSRITSAPASAVAYSLDDMLRLEADAKSAAEIYRNYPTLLAPQLRILFSDLLSKQVPLVYNCSAGQDRTGFATAMILAALGVSRSKIYEDYHLSTTMRRPAWELPDLAAAAQSGDPLARRYAPYLWNPAWRVAKPLTDAAGRPQLASAFDQIEAQWGSVDAYLQQEIGLSQDDVLALRKLYLE